MRTPVFPAQARVSCTRRQDHLRNPGRTTRRYDHSRDSLDRNAAYTVAAYLA
jgi:hypothetical protein